jgi:nucleotide-binding universal stress UspA family protein
MTTVLVGVDATEHSDDAIALARELVALSDARLVLASSVPTPDVALLGDEVANDLVDDAVRETNALLEDKAGALRDAGIAVEHVAKKYVSPAFLLQSLAEERKADLVVVGSTHRSALGRVLPGSTGERLLHGSPCPVAVAPAGYRTRQEHVLQRIGVAFDGSDEARAALRAGVALAERAGARLDVIAVLDVAGFGAPALMGGPGYGRTSADLDARATLHLGTVVADLPAGARATGQLLTGAPAAELARASESLDLLLVGSRRYGPLRAVLLGGVSGRVIRHAACPVVVTPRGVERPLRALLDGADLAAPTT